MELRRNIRIGIFGDGVVGPAVKRLRLAELRVGSSHSSVTAERGFRGRCPPKDVSAMVAAMKPYGRTPLTEAVMQYNTHICAVADEVKGLSADAAKSLAA
jgi:UDP-glucose 6-dehydrogenase